MNVTQLKAAQAKSKEGSAQCWEACGWSGGARLDPTEAGNSAVARIQEPGVAQNQASPWAVKQKYKYNATTTTCSTVQYKYSTVE